MTYPPSRRKLTKGFTLAELIVVIGIFAILAVVAIPAYASQQDTAATAALRMDARNLATSTQSALLRISNVGVTGAVISMTTDNKGAGTLTVAPSSGGSAAQTIPVQISVGSALAAAGLGNVASTVTSFCLAVVSGSRTVYASPSGPQTSCSAANGGTGVVATPTATASPTSSPTTSTPTPTPTVAPFVAPAGVNFTIGSAAWVDVNAGTLQLRVDHPATLSSAERANFKFVDSPNLSPYYSTYTMSNVHVYLGNVELSSSPTSGWTLQGDNTQLHMQTVAFKLGNMTNSQARNFLANGTITFTVDQDTQANVNVIKLGDTSGTFFPKSQDRAVDYTWPTVAETLRVYDGWYGTNDAQLNAEFNWNRTPGFASTYTPSLPSLTGKTGSSQTYAVTNVTITPAAGGTPVVVTPNSSMAFVWQSDGSGLIGLYRLELRGNVAGVTSTAGLEALASPGSIITFTVGGQVNQVKLVSSYTWLN